MKIKDSYDRTIDYVRIAITDRCNLRCFYCMPAEGIPYEPKQHLLNYEEITRLLRILGEAGFKKVRFTGGEPFLRKDFIKLLENTHALGYYKSIHITTNGTLIQKHIPKLKALGITNINLSLDSLDKERFETITRRNDFEKVMASFNDLLAHGFNVKINAVIMNGVNTQDIIPLTQLAKHTRVSVRFIEEMPFNGGYKKVDDLFTAKNIYTTLKGHFQDLTPQVTAHGDTATVYKVSGLEGSIGIIPAFSRSFCNTCNRLRITSKGDIKTCLYDGGVFSIRDYLRSGASDTELETKFKELIRLKPKDGFEAEQLRVKGSNATESMSTIGG